MYLRPFSAIVTKTLHRPVQAASGASVYAVSQRCESDKKPTKPNNEEKHPYWASTGPDDFGFLDELQEFGDDIDFDLPDEDKEFLKNEWKK
mmetsp:Transcript_6404/g.9678  ORF Transcript_6404/g.9678 Transcript_6404/m.9678 type:complete len:91 (-) Transcript_6404:49-321(-)